MLESESVRIWNFQTYRNFNFEFIMWNIQNFAIFIAHSFKVGVFNHLKYIINFLNSFLGWLKKIRTNIEW